MKKTLVIVLVVLFAVVGVFANGQTEGSQKTYTMRIGHIEDTSSVRHQSLELFKKTVEEKSNGAIKVELYPSAQLGSDDELVEQIKNGSIEGYRGSAIDFVIPEYNVYTMPFLFGNVDQAVAVMKSDWGKKLATNSEKNNVKVLATGAAGLRVLTNNVRPVHTPADMKGLKLRTPSWEVTIKTMGALGANCTSIAYNETYMALKTNVADGQENPWPYIYTPKFYEVQKYASDLNWNLTLEYFPCNLQWFNSLPENLQKIVLDAAEECMDYTVEGLKEQTQTYIDTCAKYMEITYLTPAERQMFVDATASVYDYYIGTGLFTRDDLAEIRRVIAASGK